MTFYLDVTFGLSELTCGVEIYILQISHPGLRIFHGLASALGSGLILYGLFSLVDRRV